LPSAKDNRPLMFEEWQALRPQTVFVSATPGEFELDLTGGVVVEQLVRPTGLIDPLCVVRPVEYQVDDAISESKVAVAKGFRVLVTALTKRMAEDIAEYMREAGLLVNYLHSDVPTLERIEIIQQLREGVIEVLVGVNLLREGLDIPECALVVILDADKAGFLRSRTSLIQTIGRAARHIEGRVILYADKMTGALEQALSETERRREHQMEYNKVHGITPKTIQKAVERVIKGQGDQEVPVVAAYDAKGLEKHIKALRKQMLAAASELDFERAAQLRDQLRALEEQAMGVELPREVS